MRYPQGCKPAAGAGIDLDSITNDMDLMEEYMGADDGMDF